jgi:quinol monooxygenase YgiN
MFEVTARMRIRDGDLDGFKQRAADIMRRTREQDTETLRYDWFVSEDGTSCEVREGYIDADGLLDHNTHVRESRDAFEATARLKIREGKLEAFKQQAAEVLRQMRAQDAQPLRYDWFLSVGGIQCEVREAYADADALLENQQEIAEAKMKLFRECVDGHTMSFYGELSRALAGGLQAMGTPYQQFAFFQGLDADSELLEEVRE